jgi:hypothetical protein
MCKIAVGNWILLLRWINVIQFKKVTIWCRFSENKCVKCTIAKTHLALNSKILSLNCFSLKRFSPICQRTKVTHMPT